MQDFVVISNNCSAGYFYRSIKKQFNHPFIWSGTTEEYLLKAVINWNKINWSNIRLYKEKDTNYPMVNVDNLFDLRYRHYRCSEKDMEPRVAINKLTGTPDVFYYDNMKYTEEKYRSRAARIPAKVRPSLLVMHWGNQWGCSDEVLVKLVDECVKRSIKICVITFKQKDSLELKESPLVKWIDINRDIDILKISSDIESRSTTLRRFFDPQPLVERKGPYKYSLITVNFGRYDCVWEPEEIDPNCEYVYVTDDPSVTSDVYKVVVLDRFRDKSNLYKAFYVRYHIEEFVHCKTCVWIDGSIRLHKSLAPIVAEFLRSGADMCCPVYYVTGSTCRFVKKWYSTYKKNPKRAIPDLSFQKAMRYVNKHLSYTYKGHAEANFQILKLDNLHLLRMRKEIWKDIMELGYKGDPFRIDEMVLSVKLQTKYRIIKIFMVQRQLLQSSFMSWYAHNNKLRITKIPKQCTFYFYNKQQRVHVFE